MTPYERIDTPSLLIDLDRAEKNIRDMQAAVDTSMNVTAEDKIITLSTCYGGMSDKRYLVQAVLVSEEN